MLVAPAGYGKTTLAEQWVARDGRAGHLVHRSILVHRRRGAGARRRAKRDVDRRRAATTDCASTCARSRRRPRTSRRSPRSSARISAEWPVGRLARHRRLPRDRAGADAPRTSCRRSSRSRPSSSSSRVACARAGSPRRSSCTATFFEVNQTALAMDNREAADVLVGRSARAASGLVLLANGWPAVIGLASVSSAEIEDDVRPGSRVALQVLRGRGLRRAWARVLSRA